MKKFPKFIFSTAFLLLNIFFIQGTAKVIFKDKIVDSKTVIQQIQDNIYDPQIIIWYIGESGIKTKGALFYKNIFDIFAQGKNPYHFYLYDLVAWKALRNKSNNFLNDSKYTNKITNSNLKHFSAMGSNLFFDDLLNYNLESLQEYISREILPKDFIYESNKKRKENNVLLKEVLGYQPHLKSINELDTALAYSPLQYLEGIYLIRKLVSKALKENKKQLNIVFLLSNDEAKYYKDKLKTLQENIEAMLSLEEEANKLIGYTALDLNIHFLFFKYGNDIHDRPYISREKDDKLVRPNQILKYINN